MFFSSSFRLSIKETFSITVLSWEFTSSISSVAAKSSEIEIPRALAGKISRIEKSDGTILSYFYDAMGNRIDKSNFDGTNTNSTWYIRDASGNNMATYNRYNDQGLYIDEFNIYGSSRLVTFKPHWPYPVTSQSPSSAYSTYFNYPSGYKQYELTNHLGSVLSTISDQKTPVNDDSDPETDYFTAIVKTQQDYYPFGMMMPSRTYSLGGDYKFGFNGQERTDEISGKGNHNTALFWEYDTRLGRRWNLDPKTQVSMSDYSSLGNNPIAQIDPKGDIFEVAKDKKSQDDVRNIAKSMNRDFVKFDENGKVSLDFGNWSQKKIDRRLKGDEGLSTIRDLVEAKDSKGNDEKYYYEGSNRREGILNGEYFNLTLKVESGQVTGPENISFVTNLSQTHPGTNPQTGKKYDHILPPLGYNGAVFLSPGQAYDEVKLANDQYGNPMRAIIQINRSELLKHELRENYMRTHSNQEYWPSHQNAGGYGHFTKLKYVWE